MSPKLERSRSHNVTQIRKIARMTRSTPQRMEFFHHIIRQYNALTDREFRRQQATDSCDASTLEPPTPLSFKALILDVVTRWNSLVMMLERALEYKGV